MEILYILNGVEHSLPVFDSNIDQEEALSEEQMPSFVFELRGSRDISKIEIPTEFANLKQTLPCHTLWAYVHGGISLQESPSCPFDSARIGYVYSSLPFAERAQILNRITNILNNAAYDVVIDGCFYRFFETDNILEFLQDVLDPSITSAELRF